MKCPECQKQGLQSTAQEGAGTVTCMAFPTYHDKEGKRHVHNPNTVRTLFTCSNGHQWILKSGFQCPSCDFGKDFKPVRPCPICGGLESHMSWCTSA
jgi:hypothetical protein